MKQQAIRQGDVILIPVAEIPRGLKRTKKVVLALGEATGHHHAIRKGAKGYAKETGDLCSYVEIAEALAELQHEEHATLQVPAGLYEVRIQREYLPGVLERKVLD